MYFLSFVGQAVLNPDYEGCYSFRIEVREMGDKWANEEIHMLSKKREEMWDFRETWEGVYVSPKWLEWIRDKVEEDFSDCAGGAD